MFLNLLSTVKGIFRKSTFLWDAVYAFKFNLNLLLAIALKKKIVLSRCACLGQDLYATLFDSKKYFFVCQQKTRIDVFLELLKYSSTMNNRLVRKFLTNDHFLYPFLQEQKYLHWLDVKHIDFFVMDSFSELVDKRFTHKSEGWSFCAYGSDVDQTKEFKDLFEFNGLIPLSELEKTYNDFFDWIEITYGKIAIYFIHFPTAIDERILYKERGAVILEVMKKIETERDTVKNIYIDESLVEWTEDDVHKTFPYHYSKKTVNEFERTWQNLL